MKAIFSRSLKVLVLVLALAAAAAAQDPAPPKADPPLRPRGAAQQPLRGAAKAAKQAQQQSEKQDANQLRKNELQRNRTANAVVDRYLGGFQKSVGLNDDQTRKFSGVLGNYVRRQLNLAQNRTEALKRLKELTDRQAPQEEIQAQNAIVETTENQQSNATRRFYAEMNPQLTPQQRANLKLYLETTGQNIRQAIQKSTQ